MRKITVEFPDGYDEAISITAIGHVGNITNMVIRGFDLSKGDYLIITEDGKRQMRHEDKDNIFEGDRK